MVVITPIATATEKSFVSNMPAENPMDAITNSTIPLPFIRNPIDKHCSLLNLANLAPSDPPPTLPIIATARRDKNIGIALRRLWALNCIPINAKNIGAKKPNEIAETIPYTRSKFFLPIICL